VPSHRSAIPRRAPDRLKVIPTASQADGDTQDTPFNALHAAPAGLGVGWMCQLFPSHRSASVTPVPELRTEVPTAMHQLAFGHDTQSSWPVGVTGFGVGATDQPPTEVVAGTGALAETEALAGIAPAPIRTTAPTSVDVFAATRLILLSRERRRPGAGQTEDTNPVRAAASATRAAMANQLVLNFMLSPRCELQFAESWTMYSDRRSKAVAARSRAGRRGRDSPSP